MSRKRAIGERFGQAADRYARHAVVQRLAATRLAGRIVAARLRPAPGRALRILEFGAGTGLLTEALRRHLAEAGIAADWTVTDLAPAMLAQARGAADPPPPAHRPLYLAMDAEQPAVRGGYDLVCGSLAMQWFLDRKLALRRLAGLLAPAGLLAVSTLCDGSLASWHAALRAEGLPPTSPDLPTVEDLQDGWPGSGQGAWSVETVLQGHAGGIEFLRGLRGIGADLGREDVRPAEPLQLRRALRRFEREHDAVAEYRIGFGLFRRASPLGVFVTGTGTGIGKTLVAACLVRAWGAFYWKPLQTGIDDDVADSVTVTRLAELPRGRVLRPAHVLRAPLSPEAAARLEGVGIDAAAIQLPAGVEGPLVVEGAGGLMVPIAEGELMIDLIARLGLPAVLVASSTLGTINHTLLSLEALRARGLPILGVILSGPLSPGNCEAIERHGKVRVLAEIPVLDPVDAASVEEAAARIPPLGSLMEAGLQ